MSAAPMPTSPRTALRPDLDATLLFEASDPGGLCDRAVVVVKVAWQLGAARPRRAPVDPLRGGTDGVRLLSTQNDLLTRKRRTDVIVHGSAQAGSPVRQLEVRCRVGVSEQRAVAFGVRYASIHSGRARFREPEPFTAVALSWENAYGGVDARVDVEPPTTIEELLRVLSDHPGFYPRNRRGKGWVVGDLPESVELELPQVERVDERLSPQNLVVARPEDWFAAPRPAGFAPLDLCEFPRLVFRGATPWYPAPEDSSLSEVREGLLPAHFSRRIEADDAEGLALRIRRQEEAAPGLSVEPPEPGAPVVLVGMHAEHPTISTVVPPPPDVRVNVGGSATTATARPTVLVLEPERLRMTLTYVASAPLPRPYLPGIHRRPPATATVDGTEVPPWEEP